MRYTLIPYDTSGAFPLYVVASEGGKSSFLTFETELKRHDSRAFRLMRAVILRLRRGDDILRTNAVEQCQHGFSRLYKIKKRGSKARIIFFRRGQAWVLCVGVVDSKAGGSETRALKRAEEMRQAILAEKG